MAHPLLLICPVCTSENSFKNNICENCQTVFHVSSKELRFKNQSISLPEFLEFQKNHLKPEAPDTLNAFPEFKTHFFRISGEAVLRRAKEKVEFNGFAGLFRRRIERPVPLAKGRLAIGPERFLFFNEEKSFEFRLEHLTCVTTNSHYFEFKVKEQPFFQIAFNNESPLKYEILFRKLLDNFYHRVGSGKILEYQPVIRTSPLLCRRTIPEPIQPSGVARQSLLLELLAHLLQKILRLGLGVFINVQISGKENLPDYPAVYIANHQSALDPFILIAYLQRFIGFLTKSTSFLTPFERLVLKIGRAIPTTRYQADPMAVRHWLKMLENGQPVGIFPEAERTWDGAMHPFKMAVIRVLAERGLPIVPIRIQGAFDFLPRWRHRPRRGKVKIEILPPLCLNPALPDCRGLAEFLEKLIDETSAPQNHIQNIVLNKE